MTDPVACRRKEPRFCTSFPVRVVNEGAATVEGAAKDLSSLGCSVEAETPPPPQSYVNLTLVLPDGDAPLEIQLAVVRWSHDRLFGVEFIAFGEAQKTRLKRYLASCSPTSSEAA